MGGTVTEPNLRLPNVEQSQLNGCSEGVKCCFFLIHYFLAVLGLHCCMQAFSGCGEQGLRSSFRMRASHCDGFSCCRAQALIMQVSVVVVYGLSCSTACEIFPNQGWNPCLLHWQADS